MAVILQLTKTLSARPRGASVGGVHLRHYQGPRDMEVWLDLRRRAFAKQQVGVGNWNAADFQREFLDKPWWRPQIMWFAEMQQLLLPSEPVGTITLAQRGEGPDAKPVVHWLMVLRPFRGKGIGRMLMSTLEAAVWDAGARQVWLETHSGWNEAVRLYQSLGYEPAGN